MTYPQYPAQPMVPIAWPAQQMPGWREVAGLDLDELLVEFAGIKPLAVDYERKAADYKARLDEVRGELVRRLRVEGGRTPDYVIRDS